MIPGGFLSAVLLYTATWQRFKVEWQDFSVKRCTLCIQALRLEMIFRLIIMVKKLEVC